MGQQHQVEGQHVFLFAEQKTNLASQTACCLTVVREECQNDCFSSTWITGPDPSLLILLLQNSHASLSSGLPASMGKPRRFRERASVMNVERLYHPAAPDVSTQVIPDKGSKRRWHCHLQLAVKRSPSQELLNPRHYTQHLRAALAVFHTSSSTSGSPDAWFS